MICPECQLENAQGSTSCVKCKTPLESLAQTEILESQRLTEGAVAEGWSVLSTRRTVASDVGPVTELPPGAILGGRYEIIKLLGEGGMGAVYKAMDRELDRLVALKVIRPELARNPTVLRRFKQELILARQVTHTNVIRIFDLGVADGIKFITMEYIEGKDVATLLRERGKFTPSEAVDIMQQICRALVSAHSAGVVHRDLKPQNIMVDTRGKVSVMDFGIARSTEEQGMTQTGALMGTPAYMSPEQAKGQKAGPQSDLFTVGIIFYELLTGKIPFESETSMGTLMKRLQEQAVPPIEVDPAVPPALNGIVLKCLATDPNQRYQTGLELLDDLEVWETKVGGKTTRVRPPRLQEVGKLLSGPRRSPKWIATGIAVILLAAAGLLFRGSFVSKSQGKVHAVTLLVADFNNATGDPVFDGTLESALTTELEGASFITAYNRGQARKLAGQLEAGATRLDERLARLIAVREGIHVITSGSIDRKGEGYKIAVKAIDAVNGKMVDKREVEVSNKDGVLPAVGKLAAHIRNSLGDATPESLQIAASETFTTASLDAGHYYAMAQEAQWAGKAEQQIRDLKKALELDPNLGRAYANLAVAYVNLKRQPEAGENYKKALALLDRMSARERYRTLGGYYLGFVRNYGQAIETYRKLIELFPSDNVGYNNLSIAYVFTRNIPEALASIRKALEIHPENLQNRLNYALYSMYAGEFGTAIAEAERVLKQNASYEFPYLPLALSNLAKGETAVAREAYARLEKVSPEGYSLAKTGEADLEMYLGRYKAALQPIHDGIAADEKQNNSGELAQKYLALAEAQLALGQRAQAIQAAAKAAQLSRVESILYPAGRVLVQAGDEAGARALATELDNMLQSQTKSYARLIAGELALQRKRVPEAVQAFQDGQKLLDSWIAHFLLGRAYLQAGHFPEALSELEVCLKRRGETTDLLFADTSTLRYLPPLYYWLGLAQEGVGTKQAAHESFQEFLKLRADAEPGDPLVTDARRRSGM